MKKKLKKFECIKSAGDGDYAVVGKIYNAYWCDLNGAYVSKVEGTGLTIMERGWFREIKVSRASECVARVHSLAVELYSMMGYLHKDTHKKLYDSQHPTEQLMWRMAVHAYRTIDGLDGDEYLEELREEEGVSE